MYVGPKQQRSRAVAKILSEDATFDDLRVSPNQAERFLRNVLEVMRTAQKTQSEVRARMGTTGTGQAPNYRLEDTSGWPFLAIDGANHQPWPEGESFEGAENWSSVTASYEDVEKMLRSMTGYKGPGTIRG